MACSMAPPSMLFARRAAITLIRGIDTGSISLGCRGVFPCQEQDRHQQEAGPASGHCRVALRPGAAPVFSCTKMLENRLLAQRGEARLGAGRDLVAR